MVSEVLEWNIVKFGYISARRRDQQQQLLSFMKCLKKETHREIAIEDMLVGQMAKKMFDHAK